MKLSELYFPYEQEVVDKLFNQVLARFKSQRKAPYLDKYQNPKEDEFLELASIDYTSGKIYFRRRLNNPERWDVSFGELKNAVKATVRLGRILRPSDYLKMDGKSNFVGTPLHLLISLLSQEEYQKYSLANRYLSHQKFGKVKILGIEYPENNIHIEYTPKPKAIKIEFWEITKDEFKEALNESSA